MKSITTAVIFTCFLIPILASAQVVPTEAAKSPATARAISLIGTAAPICLGIAAGDDGGASLFLLGSIVGPGLGHAYAVNPGRFFLGAGIRTVGWGACAVAFASSWDKPDDAGSTALAIGGLALVTISTVVDISTADNSARNFNRDHPGPQFSANPIYVPSTRTYGVRLTLSL